MNNGNPSRVGRRRRRTGSQQGGSSGHRRAGARSSGYSGKRRAAGAAAVAIPLPGKLDDLELNKLHLAVAGAVGLVIAIGVTIVLGNLPDGGAGGADQEDAAYLYAGGQALPDDFADQHPSLVEQINAELEARYGLTPEALYDEASRPDGLRVVLTLDQTLQEAAEKTSGEAGVVAVEPGTGAVRCYYGAEGATGTDQVGAASPHPPSSVFDMITAATALEAGASIESWWSDQDDDVTLAAAVQESRTGAMDAVALKYGVETVLETAKSMGLNTIADGQGTVYDLDTGEYGGLNAADFGTYPVSVVDMASVYATIAADGLQAETHFIERVIDSGDEAIPAEQEIATNQALAETTAQDLQFLGLGEAQAIEDRDFFGAGADYHGETTQAWFVGAIPQLSVAAWANGQAAADGGVSLWRNVIDTAIEANDYEAEQLPGASGEGEDLTDDIVGDDGQIDPDSAYCEANPDAEGCDGASSSPSASDSPSPDDTTEEPEPDPDPTSSEPEPEPSDSSEPDPEPSTTEECNWPFC
ncbi:penicillin-binding transpeptidase domain-containing protein [Glycomyces luteolus]|uniref:Penicillin-binding transpeptidase domain-containing protein n=1 Tax=Glycomyces luteolus TaxID=2670330 RepID=A0A9X3SNJ3_9ACTN|nr:penicillin-binding transpeptidase domain-containing protein [Glycomyces luteolus]MDA1358257.1 penicillin-binding transpeptidase domain-containing protein [Glycomyces luteolus]